MAKIPRVLQRIFGSNASNNGQFGSAQAGTKITSNDLSVLQQLSAWVNGWTSATVTGQNLPTLEEMQGIDYVITTQLAYLFQEGIPEYDDETNYFINSIVKSPGTLQLFYSRTDDNLGNALTVSANWGYLGDLDGMISKSSLNTTAVGNVGSGEDDLMTYSLAANRLFAAGRGVRITASGTAANNGNAKTLKLYFGSGLILTTALTISQAGTWRVVAEVYSTGTDAQLYTAQLNQGGATTLVDVETGTLTQDDGAAIIIKFTGEATTTDDIIQKSMMIEYIA